MTRPCRQPDGFMLKNRNSDQAGIFVCSDGVVGEKKLKGSILLNLSVRTYLCRVCMSINSFILVFQLNGFDNLMSHSLPHILHDPLDNCFLKLSLMSPVLQLECSAQSLSNRQICLFAKCCLSLDLVGFRWSFFHEAFLGNSGQGLRSFGVEVYHHERLRYQGHISVS